MDVRTLPDLSGPSVGMPRADRFAATGAAGRQRAGDGRHAEFLPKNCSAA